MRSGTTPLHREKIKKRGSTRCLVDRYNGNVNTRIGEIDGDAIRCLVRHLADPDIGWLVEFACAALALLETPRAMSSPIWTDERLMLLAASWSADQNWVMGLAVDREIVFWLLALRPTIPELIALYSLENRANWFWVDQPVDEV